MAFAHRGRSGHAQPRAAVRPVKASMFSPALKAAWFRTKSSLDDEKAY